ncbi:MAG: MotA/TolQ/ExbB proton channel family protein [Rhodospirillales bacterium]
MSVFSHLDLLMPPIEPRRIHLDRSALGGIAAAFTIFALAIALGGSALSFIDVPSILIVFGGTISTVAVCYSFKDIVAAARAVRLAVGTADADPGDMAIRLLAVADYARHAGILAMQTLPRPIAGNPFLDKALALVADGVAEPEVEATMQQELLATAEEHRKSADVLRKAADVAPTMGLIGTLVGLVQMLRNLDRPSAIGPGMAVALLTTLYGAVLGHMVFLPLATKLERRSATEALVHQMCILCVLSISRQENPRRLETALNSVLPPLARVRVFD